MPKSLSELQQSPDVGLPEDRVTICVAARLVAELAPLDKELFEVEGKIERLLNEREEGVTERPKRLGEKGELPKLQKRAKELADQADAVRARIEENSVEVLLRGKPLGEWRRWAGTHPPRDADEDPQGAARDKAWAGERVNIDAVAENLRIWAASYNGEEPSDAWAEFVAAKGAPAHLTVAASRVVGLHEQVVDAGKSRRAWLDARRSETTSD